MRAENHCFIGHFAAANFAYYVFLVHGTADFVGHAEAHTHFARVGGYRSRQPHGILARDHCLGNPLQCSVASVGVAIQQQAFASAHPENCRGTSLYGALDYTWWLRVLAEEVRPLCAYIGMGEQNRAFGGCAGTRKILVVAITDVDEICFYSAGGGCGRPA